MTTPKGSILIKNGTLVTMDADNSIIEADLYIENGRIARLGRNLYCNTDTILDATGQLVLPGFVQTHIHLCQVLFRGLADDVDVVEWLKYRIWPLETAHNEVSIHASAALGIAELMAGGTTCALSMETTRHTESVFDAIDRSQFRAISGNAMMDVCEPGTDMKGLSTEESLNESRRLYALWHGRDDGRIGFALMPRGVRNCSSALWREVRDFAAEDGLLIHTHVSENRPLSKRLHKETGLTDMELLAKEGIAGSNLVIAHGIWLTENDRNIIRDNDVRIAHCPSANLKLSSGFCMVPEMLEDNISISLGADGAPCNNNLDMFNEMRLAALIHKPRAGPKAMDATTVLRMATIEGARCLGLEREIGSIEVGKQADIILLNTDAPHCNPAPGVPVQSRIVYSMRASDVDTTIIAGRLVYHKKQFTQIDYPKIRREAEAAVISLLHRVPFGQDVLAASAYKRG